MLRRNGGTDTGNDRCHSTEVHCLRYFANGKERDERFLKCSMNTGELQLSVNFVVDPLVFHRQLHQCRLFVLLSFFLKVLAANSIQPLVLFRTNK